MPSVHLRSTYWSHTSRRCPARSEIKLDATRTSDANGTVSMRPSNVVPVPLQKGNSSRRIPLHVIAVTSSNFRFRQAAREVKVASHNLSRPSFIVSRADMKLLSQSNTRVQRPAILEWHRWFAWYPVPLVIDGKLHYAWLHTVERKWGTSTYSGTIKWRYRLPARSRSRKRF
jgi:hypothetical protein